MCFALHAHNVFCLCKACGLGGKVQHVCNSRNKSVRVSVREKEENTLTPQVSKSCGCDSWSLITTAVLLLSANFSSSLSEHFIALVWEDVYVKLNKGCL